MPNSAVEREKIVNIIDSTVDMALSSRLVIAEALLKIMSTSPNREKVAHVIGNSIDLPHSERLILADAILGNITPLDAKRKINQK